MNRRHFLLGLAAAATAGVYTLRQTGGPPIGGEIVGASQGVGHRLREGHFPSPGEERKLPVAIVGGGIAGLSAGWKLAKAGFEDFELLELEAEVGGNARSGENNISAYPWGAHYLPFPTQESKAVRELLAELGVLQGDPYAERPTYEERAICFAPEERLYLRGVWQEGLWPQLGVKQQDLDQYRRFQELILAFQQRRDNEGRKAFAIPMALSAQDPELLALDRLSIRDYLLSQGLDSAPLHWHVDYACRDDYGCHSSEVSAWAGIHYFASRDARALNADSDSVLTWPEGNGWIVKQLRQRLQARITTNALVYCVTEGDSAVSIDVFLPKEKRSIRLIAQEVIWACPVFLAPYVLSEPAAELNDAIGEFQYAPWLVANLSLRAFPKASRGMPLAWDNVIMNSDSLGYVVATHQSLATHPTETVLTYYHALADGSPLEQRKRLLATSWSDWIESILYDLSRPHPDIRELVSRIDIIRWGHAMVRPRVGFIWSEARRRIIEYNSRIHFAHSDLSGYSIFEEAQYRGVLAAERVLDRLGVDFYSSL